MQLSTMKLIAINVLGWSCYSFADTITKHLTQSYDVPNVLIFSGFLGLLALSGWVVVQRGVKALIPNNITWNLVRAANVAAISFCVLNSIKTIPLADFYGITFVAPFLTLILLFLVLKENVGWPRWLSVIIGFIGVFVLAGPQFVSMNDGHLYAIGAALFVGTSTIVIRKIGKGEYLPIYGLYGFLGIFSFNALFFFSSFVWPDIADLPFFIATSLFVVMGQVCVTYSIAYMKEAAIIAPFQYVQVVWGVLFGFIFFSDVPTGTTYLGLALIISAGLFMIYREYRSNHPRKTPSTPRYSDPR